MFSSILSSRCSNSGWSDETSTPARCVPSCISSRGPRLSMRNTCWRIPPSNACRWARAFRLKSKPERRGIDAKQGRARSEHQGGAGLQSRAAGERHRTDVEVQLVDRRIFENAPRAGHLAQGVVRIAVEKEGPGDCRCCLGRADHRGCLAPFGAADEQIVGLKAALRDLPGAVLGMVFER